jgi:fructokinase
MACFGGIEAGGTKFVCGVGTGPNDLEKAQFPTTTPEETVQRACDFFRQRRVDRLGVASFGPVDLCPASPTFGHITSTPKTGWRNFDIVGQLRRALGTDVAFDTDVNGAVLAEVRWGAARGLTDALYLTVGTGIGGGAIVGGQLLHGLVHPEMGHVRIPHDRQADPFDGCCPYHGDCLEGLASGTAMAARWGTHGRQLPAGHPAWDLEAHYLALGLMNWVCTLSPKRIILGGGVMHHTGLLPLVRQKLLHLLNGYVCAPELLQDIDTYVVAPQLGDDAGVLGAIALAASGNGAR